jgi:hypothetical protein
VQSPSNYNVYFAVENGIAHYNSKVPQNDSTLVVKEDGQYFADLTCFSTYDDLFVFGDADGHINLYSNKSESYLQRLVKFS